MAITYLHLDQALPQRRQRNRPVPSQQPVLQGHQLQLDAHHRRHIPPRQRLRRSPPLGDIQPGPGAAARPRREPMGALLAGPHGVRRPPPPRPRTRLSTGAIAGGGDRLRRRVPAACCLRAGQLFWPRRRARFEEPEQHQHPAGPGGVAGVVPRAPRVSRGRSVVTSPGGGGIAYGGGRGIPQVSRMDGGGPAYPPPRRSASHHGSAAAAGGYGPVAEEETTPPPGARGVLMVAGAAELQEMSAEPKGSGSGSGWEGGGTGSSGGRTGKGRGRDRRGGRGGIMPFTTLDPGRAGVPPWYTRGAETWVCPAGSQ